MPNDPRTQQIAERINPAVTGQITMAATAPSFSNMAEVLEFSKVMSTAGIAIRKHLRGNPGACAAICLQAWRWRMDPYMVGNKSYEVSDQLGYESQLIVAVVNTRAPIRGRLKARYVGDGPDRKCIVSGWIIGEDEPTEVESPKFSQILPKNSPLWKTDPDQQLFYYTSRVWARRVVPEVLLGAYDVDEISEAPPRHAPDHAYDVTPPQRPTRESVAAAMAAPITDVTDHDEDGVVPDDITLQVLDQMRDTPMDDAPPASIKLEGGHIRVIVPTILGSGAGDWGCTVAGFKWALPRQEPQNLATWWGGHAALLGNMKKTAPAEFAEVEAEYDRVRAGT